jgi:hypothetical protein
MKTFEDFSGEGGLSYLLKQTVIMQHESCRQLELIWLQERTRLLGVCIIPWVERKVRMSREGISFAVLDTSTKKIAKS